jgi:hypothetical protein
MEANELPKPRTSVAAIISLICGLLGCIPFVTGLAAVILGIVGIKKTKDPMVKGKGMAIAGLVLGCLSIAGWAIGAASIGGFVALVKMGEPARAAAEQFTRDVSEGKIDAAVAKSVEGMDRASIEALSEKMKPWGPFKSLTLLSTNIQNDTYSIGGIAIFGTEAKAEVKNYKMTLNKEGETYKVAKFDFP